jgi:hypothetical protein
VRQNFHAYSGLPAAQREQLRQRWLSATPQERTQMLQRQRAQRVQHAARPPPMPRPRFHR